MQKKIKFIVLITGFLLSFQNLTLGQRVTQSVDGSETYEPFPQLSEKEFNENRKKIYKSMPENIQTRMKNQDEAIKGMSNHNEAHRGISRGFIKGRLTSGSM